MVVLDWLLFAAELVLVPLSIAWLVLAITSPRPKRARRAVILAAVLALTVAQPLGIVAEPQPQGTPDPSQSVDPDATHVARLAGIPLLPFRVFARDDFPTGLENTTTQTLRARSWLWVPLLTNSTEVADTCSGASDAPPCYKPEPEVYPARDGLPPNPNDYAHTLSLFRDGDSYVAYLTSPYPEGTQGGPSVWRLSVGLASPLGLAYWLIAGALATAAFRRRHLASAVSEFAVTERSSALLWLCLPTPFLAASLGVGVASATDLPEDGWILLLAGVASAAASFGICRAARASTALTAVLSVVSFVALAPALIGLWIAAAFLQPL